jgi:hypothetical protein
MFEDLQNSGTNLFQIPALDSPAVDGKNIKLKITVFNVLYIWVKSRPVIAYTTVGSLLFAFLPEDGGRWNLRNCVGF